MLKKLNQRFALAIALAVTVGFTAGSSKALSITPTDFDGFLTVSDSPVTVQLSRNFMSGADTIGTLVSQTFFNATSMFYTYVLEVTPGTNIFNVDDFHTEFDVRFAGFNSTAGYSFTEAAAALPGFDTNNPSDWISIDRDDIDGTLDWEPQLDGWSQNETITYFFQATQAPILRDYGISDTRSGPAEGFAPVPEPGSAAVFMTGFSIVALAIRRRRAF